MKAQMSKNTMKCDGNPQEDTDCPMATTPRHGHSESWDYAWSSMKSDDHREKTIVIITEPTIQNTVNKQIKTATG